MTSQRPVVLVTGASGGIGEAMAYILASEGEELVLVARSADGLSRVASTIEATGGRRPLTIPLDLERAGAAEEIAAALAGQGLAVRHLINNAGFGLSGDVADIDRTEQVGMVDLNCRALLDLTLAFLPQIVAARGGVLNVASVAALTPGPGLAVYYATKAFVLSFTRALAHEMRGRGVLVSALCPGPVATGFGKRAGFGFSRLAAIAPNLAVADVARIGIAGYRRGKPVIVPGGSTKAMVALLKILPGALVLPVLSQVQRRRRVIP